MSRMLKYPLQRGINYLQLPSYSLALSVHFQENQLYLWVLNSTRDDAVIEQRCFMVLETGELYDTNRPALIKFIGTAHMTQFAPFYVSHVFEVAP